MPITPPSGSSSRRDLSPRPHDRSWRLGVIRKNSDAGCTLEPRSPVLLVSRDSCSGLHPMGPTAAVTAQGDAPRAHHPAVWPQQPPWSVTSTPRPLLAPRGDTEEQQPPWSPSQRYPRQLLPPQGEDAAVDAAGDRRRRSYHPSVGAAAVVVSVTSTPRQLLSPRGGRDEAPWNSSHPSPSLAVTAAVASIQWAPQQVPPLGEGGGRGRPPFPVASCDSCCGLHALGPTSAATARGRNLRPNCLPPSGPAAAAVPVITTPQQLLPPREAGTPRCHHPTVWPQQPPWSVTPTPQPLLAPRGDGKD